MPAVFSPAKINLFLAVTGRRADGFHDLVSVVAPLDFGDELTVSRRKRIHAGVRRSGGAARREQSDFEGGGGVCGCDSLAARQARAGLRGHISN